MGQRAQRGQAGGAGPSAGDTWQRDSSRGRQRASRSPSCLGLHKTLTVSSVEILSAVLFVCVKTLPQRHPATGADSFAVVCLPEIGLNILGPQQVVMWLRCAVQHCAGMKVWPAP